MSLVTNWGYTLTELNILDDLMGSSDFDDYSAGRWVDDIRVEAECRAASAAIRNYCGWHLSPPAACEVSMTMQDKRVLVNGADLMIQLPARYVTAVSSVTIDGTAYASVTFETNGLLRVYDVNVADLKRYSVIVIQYAAGLPEALMDAVKELVAHRITHALASSNGVTTEAAGGVSVTYNANWVNSARATALPDDNKEVLGPYRLQGVF